MSNIEVIAEENCAGCLRCALACSFFNTEKRVFSLSKSNIKINRVNGENKFKVDFTENCLGCGICTDYCHFGVLGGA
jgi:carbon-monoxide dehydrogenase iron sulfur subunit